MLESQTEIFNELLKNVPRNAMLVESADQQKIFISSKPFRWSAYSWH